MRYISFILLISIILTGCGLSNGSDPQTNKDTQDVWVAPTSYAASVKNVSHIPLPVGPWACWPVQVKTLVSGTSFKMVSGNVPMTFPYFALYMPQTTMWIEPVIPVGYDFVAWDVVGTVGVVYVEGNRLTWTAPSREYTDADSGVIITLILSPKSDG